MDYRELVKKVRNSIPLVIDVDENGKLTGHGTGFVYQRNDIVITCNHVVKSEKPLVWFRGLEPAPDPMAARVVLRNIEHDVAILKMQPVESAKVLERSNKVVELGMPVVLPGYPLQASSLTVHQGIISGIASDESGYGNYTIDGTVNSGNSGGPLLDEVGQVIGVVNATRRENADLIRKVREMDEKHMAIGGIDVSRIFKALIDNLQLGVGYAIPADYIPEYPTKKAPKAKRSNNE